MKPLVLPQINLNGSPREMLVEQLANVMHALIAVQSAMGEASPNGRDYQLRPAEFRDAQAAWIERAKMVEALRKEIEEHAIKILESE